MYTSHAVSENTYFTLSVCSYRDGEIECVNKLWKRRHCNQLLTCAVLIIWTEWCGRDGSLRFTWPNKTAQVSLYCDCMTDWCIDRFNDLSYYSSWWETEKNKSVKMRCDISKGKWIQLLTSARGQMVYLFIYSFLGLCQNTPRRWQWPFHSAFLRKPWRNEQSENSCCGEQ